MKVSIYDAEPIEKSIEEEKGIFTRYMIKDRKKIVNNNVIEIEEAIVKLVNELWPSYPVRLITGTLDRDLREIKQDGNIISSAYCHSIFIKSLAETDSTVLFNYLSEKQKNEIWLVIVNFVAGICTNPDSREFPGLPLTKPSIPEQYNEVVLKHQREFIKKKAKPTKSKTKVTRNVYVRYGRQRINVGGYWTEIVLSANIRKSLPAFEAEILAIHFKPKLHVEIKNKGVAGMKIDVVTEKHEELLIVQKLKNFEPYKFSVDEIYTESNGNRFYELKDLKPANDDLYDNEN